MRESCLTITPETHFQDFCFSSLDLGLAGSGDLVSNGGMLLGALPGLVALGAKAAPSHCGLLISLDQGQRRRLRHGSVRLTSITEKKLG